MGEVTYLTKEGYERLKKELATLKGPKRKEIADQIQKARELGDLSENAEYDAAKEAQGMLEMQIAKLEEVVASARSGRHGPTCSTAVRFNFWTWRRALILLRFRPFGRFGHGGEST